MIEFPKTQVTSFDLLTQDSLKRHVAAINYLTSNGMHFWDYGNAFLLEVIAQRLKRETSDLSKLT